MSKVEIKGRIVGVDAMHKGIGYSTTLHVDALALPADLPGEIAHDAYREAAEDDGHGFHGVRDFDALSPYAKARWDAVARAVLAKAAR